MGKIFRVIAVLKNAVLIPPPPTPGAYRVKVPAAGSGLSNHTRGNQMQDSEKDQENQQLPHGT